jgi:hypothetical protein
MSPIQEASERYDRARALFYAAADNSPEERAALAAMRAAFEDEMAARTEARRTQRDGTPPPRGAVE